MDKLSVRSLAARVTGVLVVLLLISPLSALAAQREPAGIVLASAADGANPAGSPAECPALLNHNFKKLQDESDQSLCQYAGKVVLVVNTASYCGFTGQYEGLESMYARFAPQGLVILGFPTNDFSQEPKGDKDIADFCYNTYGVKFPMFAKTSVIGKNANPLYIELAHETGRRPQWNFFKYLVDRNGSVVAAYSSVVEPNDNKLIGEIEKLLAPK